MTDGFGTITWWGFSPALDLQDKDVISALKGLRLDSDDGPDELRILLVGAGDMRHLLTTVARSYRHGKRKLHFYVIENNLELYARDMLFMTIALETQKRMGLQEKTELFLELFGNILVRKQSCEYVEKMATEFIKMVTDFEYLEKKLPIFDLSQLKYKERDFLESIFKFWRVSDTKFFDAEKVWDLRLRQLMGNRYDNRLNIVDWDLNMKLVYRDADIINSREYRKWRNQGIAFEVREGSYDIPNRTLASGMVFKHEGERHHRRGYWGDILVSPYVALGIECEDKSFFKKSNNVYMKASQHIAEYNILSMFHEIATQTKYEPPKPQDDKSESKDSKDDGPTITDITEETEEDLNKDEEAKETAEETLKKLEEEADADAEEQARKQQRGPEVSTLDQEYEALSVDGVKVTFLPISSLTELSKKSKYKNLFHVIYFANSLVHLLKEDISPVFADQATLILESARYMLELKTDQVAEFGKTVTTIATDAGCEAFGTSDFEKAKFFKFSYNRKSS
ncbi:dynein assembly factor 3, axonemal-like [Mizuhopecten yessoensis]|uniref:Dynein assembly factor 3, axonemal n=1 Tax=Mizuhopecten yessoensis TaxID=6573 RepID=A0A210QGS5_MIZYE|nr:dynein assembly factor 3, axonemal-like [Mizuhopecten yessoensis]OWF47948.1 Dynein assembly factor 3, axonemal [Mizuhopecten yessoensis]